MQGNGVKGGSQSGGVRHSLRIRISNGQQRAGSITLSWLRVLGLQAASNVPWTEKCGEEIGHSHVLPAYSSLTIRLCSRQVVTQLNSANGTHGLGSR